MVINRDKFYDKMVFYTDLYGSRERSVLSSQQLDQNLLLTRSDNYWGLPYLTLRNFLS